MHVNILAVTLLLVSPASGLLASDRWTRAETLNADEALTSLEFSRNGKSLIGGGNFTLRLWDVQGKSPIVKIASDRRAADAKDIRPAMNGPAAFAMDGSAFAGLQVSSSANRLVVRRAADNQEVGSFDLGEIVDPHDLEFTPDGMSVLAAGFVGYDEALLCYGTIVKCDLSTKKIKKVVEVRGSDVDSIAISQDGKWCVFGQSRGRISVLSTTTWESIREIRAKDANDADIIAVDVSRDGRWIASGGRDYIVRVWESDTGKERGRFANHIIMAERERELSGMVRTVVFSPDARLVASGGVNSIVRLWDWKNGIEAAKLDCGGRVWSVAFSHDGNSLAISVDGSGTKRPEVQIWKRTGPNEASE